MIKHIVMWNLKDSAENSTKESNLQKMKNMLQDLKEKISEINKIEVGINFSKSDFSYDVVLYTDFSSKEDLETYRKHPEHIKVANFVKKVVSDRAVVDYEI